MNITFFAWIPISNRTWRVMNSIRKSCRSVYQLRMLLYLENVRFQQKYSSFMAKNCGFQKCWYAWPSPRHQVWKLIPMGRKPTLRGPGRGPTAVAMPAAGWTLRVLRTDWAACMLPALRVSWGKSASLDLVYMYMIGAVFTTCSAWQTAQL
jgi:hypothetical protein